MPQSDVVIVGGAPANPSGEPRPRVLYFIRFTHSLRGHLFEANLAAKRLATNTVRYLGQSA
jgi:hypothetical protein